MQTEQNTQTPLDVLNQADQQFDFVIWALSQLLPAAAESDDFYPLAGIYESLSSASDLLAEARTQLRQGGGSNG